MTNRDAQGDTISWRCTPEATQTVHVDSSHNIDCAQEAAAVCIQAAFRGRMARRQHAPVVQPCESAEATAEDAAAVRIQAAARGHAARQALRCQQEGAQRQQEEEDAAAVRIQAAARGRAVRRQHQQQRAAEDAAAIRIQAAVRGRQVRRGAGSTAAG